ncbi:hypothetical protein [Amycolatopsis thermophila]|uniref:Uncharacterized protein n=1 Tax=Amycolatopsis thermophila TaxID=206084 RepID=A0ABU0EZM6_9PSEU|nr:hypothetical protein [Amycolatopsis thermophila]MDQ0380764.1 hypothetical protein [Amycolatopsis thermophila]
MATTPGYAREVTPPSRAGRRRVARQLPAPLRAWQPPALGTRR